MSTSYVIILSDSEDEFEMSATIHVPPPPPYPHVSDDDTETEPFEDESSETESLQDDATTEEMPVTPTASTAQTFPKPPPSFHPYRTHPGGPLMMHTPRKSVRLTTPDLSPTRGTTPTAPPGTRLAARRWGWMPGTLEDWRKEEGIPRISEVGESSNAARAPPLTLEPTYHTVPLLVARIVRQEEQIRDLQLQLNEVTPSETVQAQVLRMEDSAYLSNQILGDVHAQMAANQTEIASLRARLELSEQRASELEQNVLTVQENFDLFTGLNSP